MTLASKGFFRACAALALAGALASPHAAPAFVNGLLLDGNAVDASGGTAVNGRAARRE